MLSVVIPTFNRSSELQRCLEALDRQTLDRAAFEVIVVDDGSSDGTAALLVDWVAGGPNRRFRRQSNAGPAAARNHGADVASGRIIVFTDDDCIPAPDWLERIHERYSQGFQGCLHGATLSRLPAGTFVHSVQSEGNVITSNLAVEKDTLDAVGRFDASFPAPWCEDADLYYRLKRQGIPIAYAPHVIVDHPPKYQSFQTYWHRIRYFEYYGLLSKKHPDFEPFSSHLGRIRSALRKAAGLAASTGVANAVFGWSPLTSIILSPAPFWGLDLIRVIGIHRRLAPAGIRLTFEDWFRFTTMNWATSLAEAYHLLRGWVRYRWK